MGQIVEPLRRERFFFSGDDGNLTYFPWGGLAGGVLVPFGREPEFRVFQRSWSIRMRVGCGIGALLVVASTGWLRATALLLIVGLAVARHVAVRHVVGGLAAASRERAPRIGLRERVDGVALAPVIGLLLLSLFLIANGVLKLRGDVMAGHAINYYELKAVAGPLIVVSILGAILLVRRPPRI